MSLIRPLPRSTLFPYTTLFRSRIVRSKRVQNNPTGERSLAKLIISAAADCVAGHEGRIAARVGEEYIRQAIDRKSTRLNSSHSSISYAVFCLKKKKKKRCPLVG